MARLRIILRSVAALVIKQALIVFFDLYIANSEESGAINPLAACI